VLAATLAASHTIPVESIALVLGIHRLLSSAFVFTNITGNAVATLVVGAWENAVDRAAVQTELDRGFVVAVPAGPAAARRAGGGAVSEAQIP
jgi:aerobic C4-dicarboxylate transport protein